MQFYCDTYFHYYDAKPKQDQAESHAVQANLYF